MTFTPTLPVQQRNGRRAIVMGVLPEHLRGADQFVISAMVEGSDDAEGWSLENFKIDGRYGIKGDVSGLDLVNVPVASDSEFSRGLLRSFPTLAYLCRIEAIADSRHDNDVGGGSKLAKITELARLAITALTDQRHNPLFLHSWAATETERWAGHEFPVHRPPMMKPVRRTAEAAE